MAKETLLKVAALIAVIVFAAMIFGGTASGIDFANTVLTSLGTSIITFIVVFVILQRA